MPDFHTFAIVALASLVLVVMPGPAVIYALTRIISQGRAAGLASALGVNLRSVFHVVAAVAGLSLVLASSAAAYTTLKRLGVIYLAWIGYSTIRTDDSVFTTPQIEPRSLRRIFFLAFLPSSLTSHH